MSTLVSMQSQNLVASSKHLCVERSMDNYYEKILNLCGPPNIIVSYLEWQSCLSLRGAVWKEREKFADLRSILDKELQTIGSLCAVLLNFQKTVLLGDRTNLVKGALRVTALFGTKYLQRYVRDMLWQCIFKIPVMVAMNVTDFTHVVEKAEPKYRPDSAKALALLADHDIPTGFQKYCAYLEECANDVQREINIFEDEQSNMDDDEELYVIKIHLPVHEMIQMNQEKKVVTDESMLKNIDRILSYMTFGFDLHVSYDDYEWNALMLACMDIHVKCTREGNTNKYIVADENKVKVYKLFCHMIRAIDRVKLSESDNDVEISDPMYDTMLNAVDSNGNTALHLAAKERNVIALYFLWGHKQVYREIENDEGETAARIAVDNGMLSLHGGSFHVKL